jgi:hypothetical protein
MTTATITINDHGVAEQVNAVIAEVRCVDRGDEQGKCHVFLDGGTLCQCEDIDLMKERMR